MFVGSVVVCWIWYTWSICVVPVVAVNAGKAARVLERLLEREPELGREKRLGHVWHV